MACEEIQSADQLYLVAAQCGQSYVFCQSGTVVYVDVCPPGTRFDVDRRTCLDEAVCRSGQPSVDRRPRQIKFLVSDDLFGDGGWMSSGSGGGRVARRQIKFRALDPDSDPLSGYDSGMVRRQIKFRSLPDQFDVEATVPDDPQSQFDGGRRTRRQIKFRSLAERAVAAKKHEEERRQIKFDATSDSSDPVPEVFGTDVNRQFQAPTLWYRRR